ncbi:14115_t:CDS:2 [Dentiscutata erythropus]|uniref:14115_t:CDS:1 n=1 Tax=Dentiscutata erythropus TaxID=1348616 RepID=A0A9N9D568_9GLOM|nr:14115_t:CDS:2 [Dentiscutata erythropus]
MVRILKNLFLISIFTSLALSIPTQEHEKNLNLKAPAAILDPQKQVTPPMVPDPQKQVTPPMVPDPQKQVTPPMVPDPQQTPTQPMVSDYHITPIKNPQNEDIEQTDAKEETDESDVSEGRELMSDPLLRSNLESLISSSSVESSESLDASEFIDLQPVRNTLDNIVSTSDHLFSFPEGPKKYRVVVLPKGKALHFVYKVIVFPRRKYAHPKIFKLIIVPGKITSRGRKVTFIVIPKDAPGSWKQYSIFIPHKTE